MSAVAVCASDVSSEAVLDQLNRLLADRRFASSERGSQFLKYVVERSLADGGDDLKEVVIAMDVYGRSSDYNPKIDSVVRVEAARLRARLVKYYQEDGARDPIRISIPKGSYQASFERLAEVIDPSAQQLPQEALSMFPSDSDNPESHPSSARTVPQQVQLMWLFIVAALLSVGWISIQLFSSDPILTARVSSALHPDALTAWKEGTQLLDLDPHTSASGQGVPFTLQRAIERFEFAVAKDPSFAQGWASLAEAYDYSSAFAGRDWNEDVRRAEAAARRAVAIDDRLAAGHAVLGLVQFGDRFQFAAAEKSYRRAIALDPRLPYAVAELVDLLRDTGRLEEAEAELQKARALLPGLPVLISKQAELELDRRQFDKAISTASQAIELKGDYGRAYVLRGSAHERKGDLARALEDYRAAAAMKGEERRALPALGYLLARMGNRAEATAILNKLLEMNKHLRNCSFQIAIVHAGLGQNDQAVTWLERAHQSHQAIMPFVSLEYRLTGLHHNERLQRIVRQLGVRAVS
jgi:tetratricopeptide (TPR) repeat protein